MTDPNGSPAAAPQYQLWAHRAVDDTIAGFLANLVALNGINFGGIRKGLIQAIPRAGTSLADAPGGASTITLTEYEWSEGAGAFIATGDTYVAGGAGEPISTLVDANGRNLYYAVTGTAGQSVSIYVSGFGTDQTL